MLFRSERGANEDPDAAPHGAYACLGEGWIALSCWSNQEFGRLCSAIGRSDLAEDPALATLAGRKSAAALIHDALSAWARDRDAHEAARLLQSAGVHAHAVNSVADLFTDPQLVSRRHWRRRRHPVIGDQAYCFPAFELSETPGDVTASGPVLGADNERVFREFLVLSDEEFNALRAKGAMD